jgi:hypothetical protein
MPLLAFGARFAPALEPTVGLPIYDAVSAHSRMLKPIVRNIERKREEPETYHREMLSNVLHISDASSINLWDRFLKVFKRRDI